MKKRTLAILLAVCVGTVMILTGCGKPYSSYDLKDYIKVGKYKGLEVEKYTVNVTSKQVDKEIKSRLKDAAETKNVTSGTVKDGDTVVISYVGKIDGKTFDHGSQDDVNLTIGSGQFIDGFESGLVGVKAGKTKTLHLQFPKDYKDSDVAGKKVDFEVTVNSIQKKITPTLNEEFVKKHSDCNTIKEYKASVKKDLEKKQKEEGETQQKSYLWNKVLENSDVVKKDGKEQYPDKELKRVQEDTKALYENYAKNYNMELKDFIKNQMGMSEKDFDKQVKTYSKTVVKEEEVIYAIADKEGIEVSKKEYDKYISSTLKQYGYTEKSFKEANGESFEDAQGKDNIWKAVYLEKVQDMILKNAKVVSKVKSDK